MASSTQFIRLNSDWNADPVDPQPKISFKDNDLTLTILLNALQYPRFTNGDTGALAFGNCSRYRLGETNDEGWYHYGQCRFSHIAPNWGEFYEIIGDPKLDESPTDWKDGPCPSIKNTRHFLFYFKDETFECTAEKLRIILP